MNPVAWCAEKYANVISNGPANPNAIALKCAFFSRGIRPLKCKITTPSARPRQTPAPFDCSNKKVKEAHHAHTKAQTALPSSRKRRAVYRARHESRVLYQLWSTRKRKPVPAIVARTATNTDIPTVQTRRASR